MLSKRSRSSFPLALGLVLTALLPAPAARANVLSGSPDLQLESNQDRAEMGHALGAGDLNQDGKADLVVGAPFYGDPALDRQDREGAVFVFLSPILSSSPLSAAAIFQSDQTASRFGASVLVADVDGDGRLDVLVGAPVYGTGGAVFVFLGSAAGFASGGPSTADLVFQSDRPNALFGTSLASGDFNDDGFLDVLVGAPEYTNTQSFDTEKEGVAVIFHGGPGIASGNPQTAATLLAGGQRGARFGESVAAGDVNGDGADDALIAATRFDTNPTRAGGVFVFLGAAPGGIPDGTPDTADTAILGDQFRGEIGSSLLAADLDGDGFDDLVIGAHLYDNPDLNEGIALLYPGSATGIDSGGPAAATALYEGDSANHVFGFRLAAADVNGDDRHDLLIAAPSFNGALGARVYLFLGSAGGFTGGSPATADAGLAFSAGLHPFSGLGSALATGDFDGDGFPDLAAGAPFDEVGTLAIGDEGTVQIYYGGTVPRLAPLAASDHKDGAYLTDPDTLLSVPFGQQGLLSNDGDPQLLGLGAFLDTTTSDGTLSFTEGSGAFTYQPEPGFEGLDSFTYHVVNTDGLASVPAVVTIQVGAGGPPPPPPPPPPNGAPAAAGDAYSVDENDVLTVPAPGVLGNDADPDGDPLTAILGTPPASGTLDLGADGSFTYTPDPDFFGEDSFTYQASDGAATSAAATVTITVEAVDDCPTVDLEIAFDVPFNGILNVPAPGLLQSAFDPRGNLLIPVLLIPPSHGTLVIDPSGAFTYTPFPAFRGRDFFTFAVDNGIDDPDCPQPAASPATTASSGPGTLAPRALSPPATVTIEVGLQSVLEVPALDGWGLLVLGLALALAAAWRLRA